MSKKILGMIVGLLLVAALTVWKMGYFDKAPHEVQDEDQTTVAHTSTSGTPSTQGAAPQEKSSTPSEDKTAQAPSTPDANAPIKAPTYNIEDMHSKRERLRAEATKMRDAMMKEIQKLQAQGKQLTPDVLIKELYKDDNPAGYSQQKKTYLNEIAKPFMKNEMEADGGGMGKPEDLMPVMSKAYDLLEKVDPENLKVVTNTVMRLPKQLRQSAEFKAVQQSFSVKTEDEGNNIIRRLQDSQDERATPELQKLFEKTRSLPNGDSYTEDLRNALISTFQLHQLNK